MTQNRPVIQRILISLFTDKYGRTRLLLPVICNLGQTDSASFWQPGQFFEDPLGAFKSRGEISSSRSHRTLRK
jgi:hypothetical protein